MVEDFLICLHLLSVLLKRLGFVNISDAFTLIHIQNQGIVTYSQIPLYTSTLIPTLYATDKTTILIVFYKHHMYLCVGLFLTILEYFMDNIKTKSFILRIN